MFRILIGLALAATLVVPAGATAQAPSTSGPTAVTSPQRVSLAGPRFGFTTFTGEVADQRRAADLETIMSQFGWQFETRILSQASGNQALLEWLVLLGGVESDEYNITGSFLTGYRLANGVEFGVGPTISYNPDAAKHTSSMVLAGGATLPFGDLFVPLNVALAFAEGGPRITTLIGWVIG